MGSLCMCTHVHTHTDTHVLSPRIYLPSYAWMRVVQLHFFPSCCMFCPLLVCCQHSPARACLDFIVEYISGQHSHWACCELETRLISLGMLSTGWRCTAFDTGDSLYRGLVCSGAFALYAPALCTRISELVETFLSQRCSSELTTLNAYMLSGL